MFRKLSKNENDKLFPRKQVIRLHKDEIIEDLDMRRATLFKYWKDIEEFEIVKVTRKIGKVKLYKLNEENEIVQKLILLDKVLCRQAMEQAIQLEEPQKIMVPV